MLIGFNETHLQIKRVCPAAPEQYALLIKGREARIFGANVKYFEKGGEK